MYVRKWVNADWFALLFDLGFSSNDTGTDDKGERVFSFSLKCDEWTAAQELITEITKR